MRSGKAGLIGLEQNTSVADGGHLRKHGGLLELSGCKGGANTIYGVLQG
jgi:hypothetical protein